MAKKRGIAAPRQNESSRIPVKKDQAMGVILGIGVTGMVAWLFYDSLWALVLGIGVVPVVNGYYRKYQQEKRQWEVLIDLREMLLLLSSYMQAGVAIENAFLDGEQELNHLTEKEGEVQRALHRMNEKVKMSVPVEQAFLEFAKEIDLEEAKEFSEVLLYAKRFGGNYIRNVQQAATKIQEKIEVNQEIETLVAEKKLELKVMMIMPMFILSYVKITSYDFISEMYHTMVGIGVMTGCLCLYVGMIWLGNKIIRIGV